MSRLSWHSGLVIVMVLTACSRPPGERMAESADAERRVPPPLAGINAAGPIPTSEASHPPRTDLHRSLPDGHGTAAEGESIYGADCALCHGYNLEGRGAAVRLANLDDSGETDSSGPSGTRIGTSYWPDAPDLFLFIQQRMPYDRPGALAANEAYAVMAYILEKNQLIETGTVLDQETVPELQLQRAK